MHLKMALFMTCMAAFPAVNPASAADDRPSPNCQGSTVDMMNCLTRALKPWDKRLNTAYQAAIKASENPARKQALLHAERAWLAYRTANCGWYAKHDGTISQILAPQCMLNMTRSRVLELEVASTE